MPQKKRHLTKADAEAIAETLRSRGWQLIEQRIRRAVSLKADELLQPLDPVKTATIRGEVAGLKLALGIPAIVQAEARGAKVEEGDETDGGGA